MNKFSMMLAVVSLFLTAAVLADLDPCEIAKLTAGDGAEGDDFGYSVSLSGDYALIGATGDDDAGSWSGSAYIFRREGVDWIEKAKLTASDGDAGDWFGRSVSLSGDYALIGAIGDDDAGRMSGSAYIFRREGVDWIEEAKLTASDAARGDHFGGSVSLSGGYALIGAPLDDDEGSANIFRREGTVWIEEAKISASDGEEGDHFGGSVSLSGDYALIGAYGDDDAGSSSGSAYIFRHEGMEWIEEAKLTASDGAEDDEFGRSLSLSGDYALIGAWGDDDAGSSSGSAYIFRHEGMEWIEKARLTASDGASGDNFGTSVSLSGNYALIGAYRDDDAGSDSGSAYVFRLEGTEWIKEAKLTAGDGAAEDWFGWSVSLSGDYALIGAYEDNDAGTDSGSAYIFGLSNAACGSMILAGPGPAYENWSLVRVFPPEQDATMDYEFSSYGAPHYGVNVTCGDVTGDGFDKIITGPGPGAVFGAHVRGFEVDGKPVPGLNFIAYGTRKWGANVAAGDLDDNGSDEIITGAGPGAVFGPHVRAFHYDKDLHWVLPMHSVSFLAYNIRHWGVNVTAGDIDGDGYEEIVTGPGPGVVFGPHVRGWNVDDGPAAAISDVSFFAFGAGRYGVVVTCGDADGDDMDEIVTARGPSSNLGAYIRGWNFDGVSISALPGFRFYAWDPSEARYGARIFAGADLDADGRDELVVGAGPDPSVSSPVKVYRYDGTSVSLWFSLQAFPSGWTHGVNVAAGRF